MPLSPAILITSSKPDHEPTHTVAEVIISVTAPTFPRACFQAGGVLAGWWPPGPAATGASGRCGASFLHLLLPHERTSKWFKSRREQHSCRLPYLMFQCAGDIQVPIRSRDGEGPLSCAGCCCCCCCWSLLRANRPTARPSACLLSAPPYASASASTSTSPSPPITSAFSVPHSPPFSPSLFRDSPSRLRFTPGSVTFSVRGKCVAS